MDGGLTWEQLVQNNSALLTAEQAAFTIPAADGLPPVHCLLGGYHMFLQPSLYPAAQGALQGVKSKNATTSLICTADHGRTWARQREELPTARALPTVSVYTLPGESSPRVYVMSGIAGPRAYHELPPAGQWMLMSEPVGGQASYENAVRGWTAVPSVPAQLTMTALPVAVAYRGQDEEGVLPYGQPGLLLGAGFDFSVSDTGAPSANWWKVSDPRNASSWQSVVSSPLYSGLIITSWPWPAVSLGGNLQGSSGLVVPTVTDYQLPLAFTDTDGLLAWYPAVGRWFPVESTCASSSTVHPAPALMDGVPCVGSLEVGLAATAHSAVVGYDEQDRPFVLSMARLGLSRMFLRACNYTCMQGSSFAPRCGTTPGQALCTPCSTCTGYQQDLPYTNHTFKSGTCRTGQLRESNQDTQCRLCRQCSAGTTLVRPCTNSTDTVCEAMRVIARPSRYMPKVHAVEAAHNTAMIALQWLAGLLPCVIALVSAVMSSLPCRPGTGSVQVHLPAVLQGAGRIPTGIACTTSTSTSAAADAEHDVLVYIQTQGSSTRRESLREYAGWALSLALATGDIAVTLACQISLCALGVALLNPEADGAPVSDLLPTFAAYGKGLLTLLLAHCLLTVCTLVGMTGKYTVSLAADTAGAVALWAESPLQRMTLACVVLALPLHSRLVWLLLPGSPLRFPAPVRLYTLLSLTTPLSLFVFDAPALAIVCGALSYSGYPSSSWTSAVMPSYARAALVLTCMNLTLSMCKVAWDIAACSRNGGVYRFRRAVLALPEWQWFAGRLLPVLPSSSLRRERAQWPVTVQGEMKAEAGSPVVVQWPSTVSLPSPSSTAAVPITG